MDRVTVVIPHIPTRQRELVRAIDSVARQTHPARTIVVATDLYRDGSAITRNRALLHLDSNWVAFLDDDDEWDPNHLEVLVKHGIQENAGVVYTGCRVLDAAGNEIPRREEWGRFGQPFDGDLLRQMSYIPVTSLVSVYLARQALFATTLGVAYDDWGFYLDILNMGAKFIHVPEVTWTWHHHGGNTSGRPDRW